MSDRLKFSRSGVSSIGAHGPRLVVRVHRVQAIGNPAVQAHEVTVECGQEVRSRIYDTAEQVKLFLDGVAAIGAITDAVIVDNAGHETSAKQWHALRKHELRKVGKVA